MALLSLIRHLHETHRTYIYRTNERHWFGVLHVLDELGWDIISDDLGAMNPGVFNDGEEICSTAEYRLMIDGVMKAKVIFIRLRDDLHEKWHEHKNDFAMDEQIQLMVITIHSVINNCA